MQTPKLLTLCCILSAPASAKDFAWLSGHWCAKNGAALIEEHWLPAQADLMLGVSRTIKTGKTVSFEFLRIELKDGVANYVAQPQGAPPTIFRLVAAGSGWARFENPRHDFPRRVEYRRTLAGLHAEIAGPGEGGKEVVIPFEYLPCDAVRPD